MRAFQPYSRWLIPAGACCWLPREVIREANPEQIICIGKSVSHVLEGDIRELVGDRYTVIAQPNAHLSSEEHMASFRQYSKICNGLGASEAVPVIMPLLRDPEEWVRKSAAKSLGMLRARSAVNDLISALGDSSYMVRKNAARSLGQIGGDAVAGLRLCFPSVGPLVENDPLGEE